MGNIFGWLVMSERQLACAEELLMGRNENVTECIEFSARTFRIFYNKNFPGLANCSFCVHLSLLRKKLKVFCYQPKFHRFERKPYRRTIQADFNVPVDYFEGKSLHGTLINSHFFLYLG